MRTWPLRYVLADSALFAVVFALRRCLDGRRRLERRVAGGVAALIAIGLGPLFVTRFTR